MKQEDYTEVICKGFCSFYKEGKEELLCGTYRFLRDNFTPDELAEVPEGIEPDFSEDAWLRDSICSKCDFLTDGCDYREGNPPPPCGGYVVAEFLRKKRV